MSETQEFRDTSLSVMPANVFAMCKFYDMIVMGPVTLVPQRQNHVLL